MEFLKTERQHFELKSVNLNDVLYDPEFCNKIRYTGIYSLENGVKNYVFKTGNNSYFLIKMDQNGFYLINRVRKERFDERNKSFSKNNNQSSDNLKIKPSFRRLREDQISLNLEDIMFLYKNLGSTFHVDPITSINSKTVVGGLKPAYKGDKVPEIKVLHLIKTVLEIERHIHINHLSDFEIIRYIYDKFKMNTAYYWPDNPIHAPNYTNYFGLIVEGYATCEGLADGLNQLFRYFGFESQKIEKQGNHNNEGILTSYGHAVVGLYVNDNNQKKVSYIDLSAEISPAWSDSLYDNNGRKRENPILCKDINQYKFFLRANSQLQAIDENHEGISLTVDNNGNIIEDTRNDVDLKLSRNPDAERHNSNNQTQNDTLRLRHNPNAERHNYDTQRQNDTLKLRHNPDAERHNSNSQRQNDTLRLRHNPDAERHNSNSQRQNDTLRLRHNPNAERHNSDNQREIDILRLINLNTERNEDSRDSDYESGSKGHK